MRAQPATRRAPFEVRPGLSLILGLALVSWIYASWRSWVSDGRELWVHTCLVVPAFYFLCICIHDATHHVLHRNRSLNRAAGFVLSLAIGLPFPLLQASHLEHHRKEEADSDPERVIYDAPLWALPFRLPLVPFFYLPTFRKLSRAAKLATLLHLVMVIALVCAGGASAVVGWVMPALLAISWFAFTTVYVPHSRYAPKLMRFMKAHSGYHEDHHRDVRYPFPQYIQLRAWHLSTAASSDGVMNLLARNIW
jgi:fatty acid desaturase